MNDERRLSEIDPLGFNILEEFSPRLVHTDAVDIPDNDLDDNTKGHHGNRSPTVFFGRKNSSIKRQTSRNSSTRSSMSLCSINEEDRQSSTDDEVFTTPGSSPLRTGLLNGTEMPSIEEENGSYDSTNASRVVDEESLRNIHCSQESESTNRRASRWSVQYLRNQFRQVHIEDLYQRYWVRLQRLLLFKLLLILIVQEIFIVIVYNVVRRPQAEPVDLRSVNIFISCTIVFHFVSSILVFISKVYTKTYLYIGIATWMSCNIVIFIKLLFVYTSSHPVQLMPMDNVAPVFYVTFITHTMLPFSRKLALVLAIVTAVADLVLTGVLSNSDISVKSTQLAANVLIYLCSNLVGFYHKHLTDIAHRHTFLDTRKFLESDITYCRNMEQQSTLRESLLSKILPGHLVTEMTEVLKENFMNLPKESAKSLQLTRKHSFWFDPREEKKRKNSQEKLNPSEKQVIIRPDQLHVEFHENVSVLFADIVSFTPLTSRLEPKDLVRSLNELFGRFDDLSKENNCTRIKILGDCYYCVSGLPTPDPQHAKNCVKMGIEMLHVIRDIRAQTGLTQLDMRIGIHSGNAHSGILGLRKWQYDIWSDDVVTANHMESGGVPGKVHITQATLAHLQGEFEVEPGMGQERDDHLKENDVQTFFIKEQELKKVPVGKLVRRDSVVAGHKLRPMREAPERKFSVYVESFGVDFPFNSLSDYAMERTLPPSVDINKRLERAFHLEDQHQHSATHKNFFQRLLQSGQMLYQSYRSYPTTGDQANDALTDSSLLAPEQHPLRRLTLRFKDPEDEALYSNKRDSTYKFYTVCVFVIFLIMSSVQLLTLVRNVVTYLCVGFGTVGYIALIVLTTGLKGFKKSKSKFRTWLTKTSEMVITTSWWKQFICTISTVAIFVFSIVPVLNCELSAASNSQATRDTRATDDINATVPMTDDANTTYVNLSVIIDDNVTADGRNGSFTSDLTSPCYFVPYYMFSCMSALVACSAFLRVSHTLKFILMLLGLILFNTMFHLVVREEFSLYDEQAGIQYSWLPSGIQGTLHTAVMFFTLVVLDRQIERNLRVDFLCRIKIKEEKQEVRRKVWYNDLLLANILPHHVAEHFMNKDNNKQEVYHQPCKNACVMFATVLNIKPTSDSGSSQAASEYLSRLDDIISAFDQITLMKRFKGVEKIKIIGSTYMAATGLETCTDTDEDPFKQKENVKLMIDFAWALMTCVKEKSKLAPEPMQLRIGVSHGYVIAGVIGAQRPQYDIWGDAVNVASRMDSNGKPDNIHVSDQTAMVLKQVGIRCVKREQMYIKGKGLMDTHLVSQRRSIQTRLSVDSIDPSKLVFKKRT